MGSADSWHSSEPCTSSESGPAREIFQTADKGQEQASRSVSMDSSSEGIEADVGDKLDMSRRTQLSLRLQSWRTLPLVWDQCMSLRDINILGSSVKNE
jgi:hypothetical protein